MSHEHVVAHVDTEVGFSGGEVQVFLLMQGLARRGVRNVLFCPPGSRSAERAVACDIEVQTLGMRNDLHLAAVARLAVRFARQSVELVHLHTGRANWLGGLAARIAGVPAITTRRMDRPLRRSPFTRFVYGQLVRRAVAISPAVAQRLAAGGVPASMTSTINSSVDPRELEPRVARAETRRAAGLADDDVLLLALAHLTHRKGLDVLLDALARLGAGALDNGSGRAPGSRLVLWIAGEGPAASGLAQRVASLGLGERVRFLGRREDAPDLLAACDVFVMPSRAEGLGIAALEAMAARRPVVGSRVGGLADAVVDGRTGLLVPPDDPAALAVALQRIVSDADLRRTLGDTGPARILEGFHADQMVDAYLELYREVLQEVRIPW